jgi:hypothetical protein
MAFVRTEASLDFVDVRVWSATDGVAYPRVFLALFSRDIVGRSFRRRLVPPHPAAMAAVYPAALAAPSVCSRPHTHMSGGSCRVRKLSVDPAAAAAICTCVTHTVHAQALLARESLASMEHEQSADAQAGAAWDSPFAADPSASRPKVSQHGCSCVRSRSLQRLLPLELSSASGCRPTLQRLQPL